MNILKKVTDSIIFNSNESEIFNECDWFNNLVLQNRKHLSKYERQNHLIEVAYTSINSNVFEKCINNYGVTYNIKQSLRNKLKIAGWTITYCSFYPIPGQINNGIKLTNKADYSSDGFRFNLKEAKWLMQYRYATFLISFYWDSSFTHDTNSNNDIICASDMASYEYQPSKTDIIKDTIYSKKRPFSFLYRQDDSLLDNFILWFDELSKYKQKEQTLNEKLAHCFTVNIKDIPTYFLSYGWKLFDPITSYLKQSNWEVKYEVEQGTTIIDFCYI